MSEILGRLGGPRDEEEEGPQGWTGGAEPTAQAGRWLRRHLAGGVAALTTVVDGAFRAATLTGTLQTSIEPLLYMIALEIDSQMESWVRESGVFGLSILSVRQQFLADQFAGLAPLASSRFAGIEHGTAVTGVPLLTEGIGWADCRVVREIETGDHVCFVGEALAVGRGKGEHDDPLIYYLNRYLRPR